MNEMVEKMIAPFEPDLNVRPMTEGRFLVTYFEPNGDYRALTLNADETHDFLMRFLEKHAGVDVTTIPVDYENRPRL